MKAILIYTMTSGLGDFIIMGDLVRKVELLLPDVKCVIVHRRNPHINLWKYNPIDRRFFNVYDPLDFFNFLSILKIFKKRGYTILGLQMAPGSLQGYLFYKMLKLIRLVDFIVDFNLINADIITPPKGDYILELHLNQISDIFKIPIPSEYYQLNLIMDNTKTELADEVKVDDKNQSKKKIGIHPWSRRGQYKSFVWSFENWLNLITSLSKNPDNEIIIFGRDPAFHKFQDYIEKKLGNSSSLKFLYSKSVMELIKTINELELLISVNTSVIHIGYALNKKMVILSGPSLKYWTPPQKDNKIAIIKDNEATFPGSDKNINDPRFPAVSRINIYDVLNNKIVQEFL
jgi:hypothetical protein